MNRFFAAFIPGLRDFIADVIKKRLSDAIIEKLLDGAVIFTTETTYDKLNFFCFNNIFAVIDVLEESQIKPQSHKGRGEGLLEKHIRVFINESRFMNNIITDNSKKIKTFRIVVSDENVPAAVDEKLRADAEIKISGLSGLKADRSLPDTEFWFLYRREKDGINFSVFMKRLTLRPSWGKTLHKGELPPPLAWTLCSLADLKHSDAVLDPFCGYGSIVQAAMKYFHITNLTACDNNSEAAGYAAKKFRKQKGFFLHKCDFFSLSDKLADSSIDAIVTDPPWGQYKKNEEADFYKRMFEAFAKLLKDGGRAVVLYDNNENFLKAVPSVFKLETQIPILLSGKKAVIYRFNFKKSFHQDT